MNMMVADASMKVAMVCRRVVSLELVVVQLRLDLEGQRIGGNSSWW